MPSENELNEQSIFISALELPPADRMKFVAETCGDDTSLRQRIETLLSASNEGSSWIDEPAFATDSLVAAPTKIGRYQIRGTLGAGGFGLVYLAFDDQLDRSVALKVPHFPLFSNSDELANQLAEARTVASLDHPNIVPVFDVGGDDDFPFYVVTKFVQGSDLTNRLRRASLMLDRAIELIVIMAQALDYAHTRGIVHCDVKPGNILIDDSDRPFLVDFGLALREQDFAKGARYAGTPAYMSPEQACGEGHRVDSRSDIFSLCVVLYELLAGTRPFHGETLRELLKDIERCEPQSIREHNRSVSRELERICQKGLARRAKDRYFTAQELADDLQYVLESAAPGELAERKIGARNSFGSTTSSTGTQRQPLKIVPKGLRSFDTHDADFFLGLLPGARDRDGLPVSIRFWKTRIESTDADETFSMGIIYGPAGCGKSSLIKAGLIPRFSDRVATVYIESSPSETEAGLLNRLRKRFPELSSDLGLKDSLTALRRGQGVANQGKVLIVLDQFEQWLHARREIQDTELVSALRQCDGERLMCLILVRDEFWLTLSRFMMALEIDIVPGRNAALVDLFDVDHGLRVLAAYGRAYGRLPDDGLKPSPEQQELLDAAVAGLSVGERVIPVRLALFAEMMKGRPWTTKTLGDVGGTQGVGVTLLEEAFSAPTSDPRNRYHQDGIRTVLKALLPNSGTDIKGEMKSFNELLDVSGYTHRPKEFDELLRILDSEFRLITSIDRGDHDSHPHQEQGNSSDQNLVSADDRLTDSNSSSKSDGNTALAEPAEDTRYYQLAHDYLVRSIREWLSRKQRETHSGRAELLLSERASYWDEMGDRRFFPGWLDWVKISALTRRRDWTSTERRMMRAAGRHHCIRVAAILTIVTAIGGGSLVANRRAKVQRAEVLAGDLITALPDAVPSALDNLRPLGDLVVESLERKMADRSAHPSHRLHAAFALADLGRSPMEFLLDAVATTPDGECSNLFEALSRLDENTRSGLRQRFASASDYSHRARLALVMLYLGDSQPVADLLALDGDPIDRATLIDTGAKWHGDVGVFVEAMRSNSRPYFRSGLCAILGAIDHDSLGPEQRQPVAKSLEELYLNDPDGGTHNAAGWALSRWGIKHPRIEPTAKALRGGGWFVNGQGITLLMIPKGSFSMVGKGGSEGDLASSQEVTLSHSRFIGDCEITVAQFQRFIDDPDYPASQKPIDWHSRFARVKTVSPTSDCPAHPVNWIEAAMYCNWLSSREGRQPAYRRTKGEQDALNGDDNQNNGGTWHCDLTANGYRLPTEAEWEYASRAGSTDNFCCGSNPELLDRYAWFSRNSKSRTWPRGILLPNAFGLYNTHGNLWEWCNDWYGLFAEHAVVDPIGLPTGTMRVTRGGSFGDFARPLNFTHRGYKDPYDGGIHGFRVICRE